MGCVARVCLAARRDGGGRMRFVADSDSELSRGYCACLVAVLDGATPEEVLAVDPADPGLAPLGAGMTAARSRASMWHNVLVAMQKRARAAITAREARQHGELFPSLVIARDGALRAQGSYAEAQVSSSSSKTLEAARSVAGGAEEASGSPQSPAGVKRPGTGGCHVGRDEGWKKEEGGEGRRS